MAELLYNLQRVFNDYLQPGELYNIPEYQRGYKWTDQQTQQLLTDIQGFETGGDEDLFYCLQNITLVRNRSEHIKINVVDGQQRLTTIILILSFLGAGDGPAKRLVYAVREPSHQFLQRISVKGNDLLPVILNVQGFDEFLASPVVGGYDFDYQDIFHMFGALRAISAWFNDRPKVDPVYFESKLLHQVKLIVNRIDNVPEEELFMNLNAGKVQLDGADLARAVLITRVAKQEVEDYDGDDMQDVVRVNERRVRIGWELDEMNGWWGHPTVFAYFKLFTQLPTGDKETINFDQNLHAINLLYKLWVEKKGGQAIRLAFFETKEIGARVLYSEITGLHRTLQDWFKDRQIYHYLGFLFTQREIGFKKVWDKWTEKGVTRDAFKTFLVERIGEFLFSRKKNSDDDESDGLTNRAYWLERIKDYDSKTPTNWYESGKLETFLLALDVIAHAAERKDGIPLPFLKPVYFRNHDEDKEHIFPGTPKELKAFRNLTDPMASMAGYIRKLNAGYDGERIITWNYSGGDWVLMPPEDQAAALEVLRQEIHLKRPVNSIGNLVLLHYTINRGFGNNYYADKRVTVIDNTERGHYVRNHTLKVFVKQTQNQDISNWTMDDIKANANTIANTFQIFFASEIQPLV